MESKQKRLKVDKAQMQREARHFLVKRKLLHKRHIDEERESTSNAVFKQHITPPTVFIITYQNAKIKWQIEMHCPSHTGNAFQPGQPPTPQKKCLPWVSLAPGHPAFEQPQSSFSWLQPPWVMWSVTAHTVHLTTTQEHLNIKPFQRNTKKWLG